MWLKHLPRIHHSTRLSHHVFTCGFLRKPGQSDLLNGEEDVASWLPDFLLGNAIRFLNFKLFRYCLLIHSPQVSHSPLKRDWKVVSHCSCRIEVWTTACVCKHVNCVLLLLCHTLFTWQKHNLCHTFTREQFTTNNNLFGTQFLLPQPMLSPSFIP